MLLSTAEDLAQFLQELRRESDRGLALVAAALIDDKLRDVLRSFFCESRTAAKLLDDANAPLGTFSARCEACYALGLIDDDEYFEIGLVRKVRNEFAHAKHGLSFDSPRVQGLCSSLRSPLPEGDGFTTEVDSRIRFMNAAVTIVLRIYHRPEWVALERRKPKAWIKPEDLGWRSIKSDPPPEDVPFIGVGHLPPALMRRRKAGADDLT